MKKLEQKFESEEERLCWAGADKRYNLDVINSEGFFVSAGYRLLHIYRMISDKYYRESNPSANPSEDEPVRTEKVEE